MFGGHSKLYNAVTGTAEPRQEKAAQNLQRTDASNAVLVTQSRAVMVGGRGLNAFRGLEDCTVMRTIVNSCVDKLQNATFLFFSPLYVVAVATGPRTA